ncbi:MFS transporter [Streptomyces sp. NPDC020141]|uniref:MFS transporter n=1 Tax=Streptomyces sp. NPDC020141 TaxID=3365065 RepID=UPI003798C5E2
MGGVTTATADRPPVSAGRNRGFMAAMVVDAVGSGVWITFSLLYFVYGRGIELTAAGSALSAGSLTALAAGGLAVGTLTDRLGPYRAAVLSCACRAVAFPCYLLADSVAAVAVIAFTVSFGDRLYWAAHGGLVDSVASSEQAQRGLFALLNSLRNVGLGVGALAVAMASSLQGADAALWNAIPLVNAASFAVAGVLFGWVGRTLAPARDRAAAGRHGRRKGGGRASYRGVLGNRAFLAFTGATLALTLSSVAFDSILPVYLRSLDAPLWAPPAAYVLSCVAIPVFQPLALRLGRRHAPLRLMSAAAVLVAAAFGGLAALSLLSGTGVVVGIGVPVLVFSLGEAVFGAVAMTIVLAYAASGEAGRYSAFYQLAWGLSGALGPGVHTLLFSASGSAPWLVLGCALLVGAVVHLRLDRAAAAPAEAPHQRKSEA